MLEQFDVGHEHGSSHGDGRIIRFAYPEAIYVDMAKTSYPGWRDIERRSGASLMHISGGLDFSPCDSIHLKELRASFQSRGIEYEDLTAEQTNQKLPQFHLPQGFRAVYQKDGGVVRAGPAVAALWRLAKNNGGHILTQKRVRNIQRSTDSNLMIVSTDDGSSYKAKKVVIAAGGYSQPLLENVAQGRPLHFKLQVTQEQVAYFAPKPGVKLDHSYRSMPTFIYHTPDNTANYDFLPYPAKAQMYGLPQIDVPGIKVGYHHSGPVIPNYDASVLPVDMGTLDIVSRFVGQHMPHIAASQPFQITRCRYTNTPDAHFILDYHPYDNNVVVATGFSGHGFKFGPAVGKIVTSLVLEESPAFDLSTFKFSRFKNTLIRRTGA